MTKRLKDINRIIKSGKSKNKIQCNGQKKRTKGQTMIVILFLPQNTKQKA